MAVIVGQGISVSPVADAELSHESTSTVQNKVVTDAIASEYSTSKTYSVGDVCTHDGKLYECIVDIPTAEGWTLSHWKVSNLGDNVSNLNRQLSDKQDAPATAGTAGQVLSLDDQLQPVWVNQTGGGLSEATKQALLQIAQKVAYTDVHGDEYYQDLYDALYPGIRIINTLTGCTTSNSATNITAGSSYSATITASQGYTLTGATVSITMGGVDITSTAYSNGTISIVSVTGALVITITAASAGLSYITAVYTQSGTVYDDATLDSLKSDLVVTAHYSDSSTETVPSTDYTLSGTLAEGTSTVTVTYSGKTATFTVVVAHKPVSGMDGWEDGGVYENLEIVQNEYVATATGKINSYPGWDRTGFVPCNGAGTIVFPPMPEGSSSGVAKSNWFYSDKSDTSNISVITLSYTESTTITVPSNANYFILSSTSRALASCVNGGIVPYE